MGTARRQFTDEFKREAVGLLASSGRPLSQIAMSWGLPLRGCAPGRGTGKSTMIESMRYALGLDPLGEEARKAHEGVIRYGRFGKAGASNAGR